MTTLNTAVPDVTITENGISVPDVSDVLAGRLTDMAAALGGTASESLSSPQGQLAQSDTEIIAQMQDKLLCLFNQMNPDFSTGRWQDGVGRIYFQDRIAAVGTIVTARCIGAVGTLIPAGSSAQDAEGYIYQSVDDGTITSDGYALIQFQNTSPGPIPVGSGQLNQIYRAVSGWDAIINDAPGVVGIDVESRIAFETRRQRSVARNARNMDGATLAAILDTDGVLDAYVWSNRTNVTVTIGTTAVPVLPHSIYISVYGGADEDVANAIFKAYNPGADLNGSTHFTVYDKENYEAPYPQYDMQWQKSAPTRTYFQVQIIDSPDLPSDIIEQVQNRVVATFNGEYEGISKARIGATINGGRYYAPIIAIDPMVVNVAGVTLSLDGTTYAASVTPGVDQVPTIQESDVQVVLV